MSGELDSAEFATQIITVADMIDEFYHRNGRDPDDREIKELVATAKQLVACGAEGVH